MSRAGPGIAERMESIDAHADEFHRAIQDQADLLHREPFVARFRAREADNVPDIKDKVMAAMRDLRGYFDERLKPLADPKSPASRTLDEQSAGMMGALRAAYQMSMEPTFFPFT